MSGRWSTLSVGTLSFITICGSARCSTLKIGILSCNTKCLSRQVELQAATYNVPADVSIQM